MRTLRKFWRDAGGATAIEYGLIAGLMAVSLIAGAGLLGGNISNVFNLVSTKLTTP